MLAPSQKRRRAPSESAVGPQRRHLKRRDVLRLSSLPPESRIVSVDATPPVSPRLLRDTPPPDSPPLLLSRSTQSLPLSRQNVQRLEQPYFATSAGVLAMVRTPSPIRTKNNVDTREKLAAYNIIVDRECAFDEELAEHIYAVIRKLRAADVQVSPNASKVVSRRVGAALQNEDTGVSRIEPHMLFRGEADQCEITTPVPLISSKEKVYLHKLFLPEAPVATVKASWGPLSRPIPDTCIGYVTHSDASTTVPLSDTPFTQDEERTLQSFAVAQTLHFPFLTSQWKAPNSSENLMTAANQAARDGAVIVNHLHEFYRAAYPDQHPSTVSTCHFSLTCDINNVEIWVHWREKETGVHHMEQVDTFSLRKEDQVANARNILKNIKDYAVSERLKAIKEALPAFKENQQKGCVLSVPPLESVSLASESESVSVSDTSRRLQFVLPLTPGSMDGSKNGSVTSEPVKKKQRISSE